MTTEDFGKCKVKGTRKFSSPVFSCQSKNYLGVISGSPRNKTGSSWEIFHKIRFFIKSPEEGRLVRLNYRETSSRFSLCCFVIHVCMIILGSVFLRGQFGDHCGATVLLAIQWLPTGSLQKINNKMHMKSGWASCERAMVWALGQIIAQSSIKNGRPMLIGKLKLK